MRSSLLGPSALSETGGGISFLLRQRWIGIIDIRESLEQHWHAIKREDQNWEREWEREKWEA